MCRRKNSARRRKNTIKNFMQIESPVVQHPSNTAKLITGQEADYTTLRLCSGRIHILDAN